MRRKRLLLSLTAALLLLLLNPTRAAAQEASECLTCHTTGRKLIQITREIARSRPAPAVSTESVGEG
jgi:hypothetical protein